MSQSLRDLRYDRARFVLQARRGIPHPKELGDELQGAPLLMRRLGLPLALATWDRRGGAARGLSDLIRAWIFPGPDADQGWGVLPSKAVPPKNAIEMVAALEELDQDAPGMRSAVEREVEELLQTAKLILGATTNGGHRGP